MKKLIVFLILFMSCGVINADKWEDLEKAYPDRITDIAVLKVSVHFAGNSNRKDIKKYVQEVLKLLDDIPNHKEEILYLLDQCRDAINYEAAKKGLKLK